MDVALAKAVEAYDAAQTRLDATEAAIRENQLELAITKKNLAIAQSDLTTQLVADYRSGSPDTIGVLLGAASISDMLARIDIVKRSSGHTAELVGKVLTLKKQIGDGVEEAREAAEGPPAGARRPRRAQGRRSARASPARQNRLSSIGREIKQIIAEREAAERPPRQLVRQQPGPPRRQRRLSPSRTTPASADPPAAARSTAATAAAVRAPGVAMAAVVAAAAAAAGRAPAAAPASRRPRRRAARRSCRLRSRSSACPTSGAARRRVRASTAPA